MKPEMAFPEGTKFLCRSARTCGSWVAIDRKDYWEYWRTMRDFPESCEEGIALLALPLRAIDTIQVAWGESMP